MRMMLKAQIPVETGNEAIKSGHIGPTMERIIETIKPEAAYFYAEDGKRTALFFFDLADSSDIPPVAEMLFLTLNAEVTMTPVMNGADLQAGLSRLQLG